MYENQDYHDGTEYYWNRVNEAEAKALREGKPYRLNSHDLNRLYVADWLGVMGGDPNSDALTIVLLRKGWIEKNPARTANEAALDEERTRLEGIYGPSQAVGGYDLRLGIHTYAWALTPEGKTATRAILAQYDR